MSLPADRAGDATFCSGWTRRLRGEFLQEVHGWS